MTQEQNILVIVGDILTNKQKCNIAYLLALLVFVLDSAINTISTWREESVQEWSARKATNLLEKPIDGVDF